MFGGGGSIQLARVFGIRVGVEPSWFLILFVIIWSLTGYYGDLFPDQGTSSFVLAVVSALLFFGSIVLHELGHAVVAMRNGIKIEGIDLWLFGGVAKLSKDTDSAGVEFRVAAAGPAVTALIAAVCFGAGTLISGSGEAADSARFDAGGRRQDAGGAGLPDLHQRDPAGVQPGARRSPWTAAGSRGPSPGRSPATATPPPASPRGWAA